ncbi:hypothetical protein D5086_033522 [Populus alba]|uniref:Uncharacterized protein n=1 Tax=Populus alba TaxID=43335 RepID=A0ACC4AH17_POPAL
MALPSTELMEAEFFKEYGNNHSRALLSSKKAQQILGKEVWLLISAADPEHIITREAVTNIVCVLQLRS